MSKHEMNSGDFHNLDNSQFNSENDYQLGLNYYHGRDDKKVDFDQAIQAFLTAHIEGHPLASAYLGISYYEGVGNTNIDVDKGKSLIKKILPSLFKFADPNKKNDSEAQFLLGYLSEKGLCISQDYEQAKNYYEQAMVNGNISAINNLGYLYLNSLFLEIPKSDIKTAKYYLEQAAEKGCVESLNYLGCFYRDGFGIPNPDFIRAKSYFEEAAIKGCPKAIGNLGWLYLTGGNGILQDYEKARNYFEQAARKGDIDAINGLGVLYKNGCGIPKPDYEIAKNYFKKSSSKGDADGMNQLGLLYLKGLGIPEPDYASAEKYFQQSADKGYSKAMANLAIMHKNGLGMRQPNYTKADHYIRQALKHGGNNSTTVLNILGVFYRDGLGGFKQDFIKAKECFEKAVAINKYNSDALNNLGLLYQEGLGMPEPDYIKAKDYYLKAGNQRNLDAVNNLAILYQYGLGVPQSYKKAKSFLEYAADKGHAPAMNQLGYLYEHALGMPKPDYMKAKDYYQKSAPKGEIKAITNLGNLYKNGTGVGKDLDYAIKYYQCAAEKGDENAKNNIKKNASEMLPTWVKQLKKNDPKFNKAVLRHYQLTNKDASSLVQALKFNTTLRVLDLSYNNFNAPLFLKKYLSENPSLVSINLSHNPMGLALSKNRWTFYPNYSPLQPLADFLKGNKTLTSLNLSYMGLNDTDVKAIQSALDERADPLITCNISGNPISSKIREEFEKFLANTQTKAVLGEDLHGSKVEKTILPKQWLDFSINSNAVVGQIGTLIEYKEENTTSIEHLNNDYTQLNLESKNCHGFIGKNIEDYFPDEYLSLINQIKTSEIQIDQLLHSSSNGDTKAIGVLGYLAAIRWEGLKSIDKNPEIVKCLQYAAKRNDRFSQYFLGFFHLYGLCGLPTNHLKARQLFEQAASQGLGVATRYLSNLFISGLAEFEQHSSYPNLLEIIQNAVRNGDVHACFSLGYFYFYGVCGLPKNHIEARKLFEKVSFIPLHTIDDCKSESEKYLLAELKNEIIPYGQYHLALMDLKGLGGAPIDEGKAVKLLLTSASKGYHAAQNELGELYELGLGCLPKSKSAAIQYYQAASKASFDARANLGRLFIDGEFNDNMQCTVLPPCELLEEMFPLVEASAKAGYAKSQYWLALHFHCMPIFRNELESTKWFKIAANNGMHVAHMMLGRSKADLDNSLIDEIEAIQRFCIYQRETERKGIPVRNEERKYKEKTLISNLVKKLSHRLESNDGTFHEIDLNSCHHLADAHLIQIMDALEANDQVLSINLNNINLSVPVLESIAEMLAHNKAIKIISINALKDEKAKRIVKYLINPCLNNRNIRKTTLKIVDLHACQRLSVNALFVPLINHYYSRLINLNLSGIKANDDLLSGILPNLFKEGYILQRLDLSNNWLSSITFRKLGENLTKNYFLRQLDLSQNKISLYKTAFLEKAKKYCYIDNESKEEGLEIDITGNYLKADCDEILKSPNLGEAVIANNRVSFYSHHPTNTPILSMLAPHHILKIDGKKAWVVALGAYKKTEHSLIFYEGLRGASGQRFFHTYDFMPAGDTSCQEQIFQKTLWGKGKVRIDEKSVANIDDDGCYIRSFIIDSKKGEGLSKSILEQKKHGYGKFFFYKRNHDGERFNCLQWAKKQLYDINITDIPNKKWPSEAAQPHETLKI